ncbi:MAG: hypothetical protein IMZ67_04355 [Acidobacteria bacterium]|nr:hypothetical protein [Acidobacteriota bacterium]
MRYSIRELVYVGMFGALWGGVEASLGSILHALQVPFAGLVLSGAGIAIALAGRVLIPRAGSIALIGLVTAFVKMLSVGGLVINPMMAIVIESLLAETVVFLGPSSRVTFLFAGALATTWTMVHPFLMAGVLAGQGFVQVFAATIRSAARLVGVDPSAVLPVLAVLLALHMGVGAVCGVIGWNAGHMARSRLHPSPGEER